MADRRARRARAGLVLSALAALVPAACSYDWSLSDDGVDAGRAEAGPSDGTVHDVANGDAVPDTTPLDTMPPGDDTGSTDAVVGEDITPGTYCQSSKDCNPTDFCQFYDGMCNRTNGGGKCEPRPDCSIVGQEMNSCGCDGELAPECKLRANGIDVWNDVGMCPIGPPIDASPPPVRCPSCDPKTYCYARDYDAGSQLGTCKLYPMACDPGPLGCACFQAAVDAGKCKCTEFPVFSDCSG